MTPSQRPARVETSLSKALEAGYPLRSFDVPVAVPANESVRSGDRVYVSGVTPVEADAERSGSAASAKSGESGIRFMGRDSMVGDRR